MERAWLRRNVPAQSKSAPGGTRPVTLITGGTRGIGRALAVTFASHGHDLVLTARGEDALRDTAGMVSRRFPGVRVETAAVDLMRPEAGQQIEDAVVAAGCHVRYLVNNAGIGYSGSFHMKPRAEALAVIDLNVRALTDLMARFLPPMIARQEGGVLNVASFGGLVPGPYQSIYYASKAYVISLTEAVAQEISRRGVRMSVLAPGAVDTEFHASMGAESAVYTKMPGIVSAERVAAVGYRNFMAWQTVIIPGVLPMFAGALIRFVPPFLAAPITAALLKPRRARTPARG
jgi:short-subunit dehydrogenase